MDPDPDSIWMLVTMIVLLMMSAFFSSVETAFSSFNKIRIKNLAQGGNKRASTVLKLEEKYDKLLTSVLIGNNIVNIALSSIATLYFMDIITDNESLAATLSTVIITVAVLIFGEITPKVIARENADSYVMVLAPIVDFLVIILIRR